MLANTNSVSLGERGDNDGYDHVPAMLTAQWKFKCIQ